jgi:UDP-glucose 4-epimerase
VIVNTRVLVTGGAGFIGSHVCDRFLAGGWTVDVVDDLSSGKRENVPEGATLHECDIRSPEAAQLVADGDHSVIVHLAAQMDVRKSVADPRHDAQINVIGSLNLLEALRGRDAAARARFVFASTGGAVYGDLLPPPNPEARPKNPESPYAISKLAVEHYLAYYTRVHGLETASVRFANVYGPRQDAHGEAGVVAIFCGRLLDGEPLRVFGDGRQTRDYVFVRDVAEAAWLASTQSLPPVGDVDARAFNIGTGVETSVLDLAQALSRAAGAETPIEFAPHRPGEQQRSSLEIDKAASALGWRPRAALSQGLAETYHWFAARRGAPAGASL